jgi:hypothetical protein
VYPISRRRQRLCESAASAFSLRNRNPSDPCERSSLPIPMACSFNSSNGCRVRKRLPLQGFLLHKFRSCSSMTGHGSIDMRSASARSGGVERFAFPGRKDHWAVVDLIGKAAHIRTIPVPDCVKDLIDDWLHASEIFSHDSPVHAARPTGHIRAPRPTLLLRALRLSPCEKSS